MNKLGILFLVCVLGVALPIPADAEPIMPGGEVVDPLASVRLLLQQNRPKEAAQEAQKLLQKRPTMTGAWRLLARARWMSGEPKKALEAARRVAETDAGSGRGPRFYAEYLENAARHGGLPPGDRREAALEAAEQYSVLLGQPGMASAEVLKRAAVVSTLVYDLSEEKPSKSLQNALDLLDRAEKEAPQDAAIYLLRARIRAAQASQLGSDGAEEELDADAKTRRNELLLQARNNFVKSFSLNPSGLQPLNNMVNILGRFDHHQQAADVLEAQLTESLQEDVKAGINVILGNLYEEMERTESAEKAYNAAISVNPDNLRTYLTLSDLKRRRGQIDRAIDWCDKALEREPNYINALLGKGELLLAADPPRDEEAIRIYQRLLEIDAGGAVFHKRKRGDSLQNARFTAAVNLAGIFARRREMEAMNSAFERAIEIAPESPLGHYHKARALARLGRFDAARELLDAVIERWPEFLQARLALADISIGRARKIADPAKKRKLVRLALKGHEAVKRRQPEQPDTLYLCARDRFLLWRIAGKADTEKLETARQELKKALEAQPNHISAGALLGSIHEAMGRYEDSADAHRQVLEVEPVRAVVFPRNNLMQVNRGIRNARLQSAASLAWILVQHLDRPQEAHNYVEMALELAPNHPSIRDTLGWIRYKQGEYEAARNIFREALEGQPESATILYHMGATLMKLGERQRAAEYLQNALDAGKDNPQFTDGQEARALLKEMKQE